MKYILTPIEWFYGEHQAHIQTLVVCQPSEIELLEHYLRQQSAEMKQLRTRVTHHLTELLQGRFNKYLKNLREKLSLLEAFQKEDRDRILQLVLRMRHGKEAYSSFAGKVSLNPPDGIQSLTKEIYNTIDELEANIKITEQLEEDRFEYCDVAELGLRDRLKEDTVKDLLLGNDASKIVFFSNHTLQKQNPEDWMMKYSGMIADREKDRHLQLVYADFTFSTYSLSKMEVVRLSTSLTNSSSLSTKPSQSMPKRKAPPPPSPVKEYINIVLLGESGVGKSTFINALANYLRFSSLDEAEQGEPIVIIPVSYVMTINDDFEERIVKFGDIDANENHNDFGQSVTQQCRSYVFNISDKRKLRIIDTPGFGDTRGNEQDDLNMEMIFSFLSNFTYVDGICLLFKSEVVQLNPYLRSCCTQLFDYFGENIRDHLIFCFTNARSTFFTPGNIRPLLNTFFESFPVKQIPFDKPNSFSFDSESFRYLVAIRNDIKFEDNQRGDFEQSWRRSVVESKRFRDLLCKQKSYERNAQWRSMKDAQFQINQVIRPMLEATRNLLRNIILHKANCSIQLLATPAEPSSILCYSCEHRQSVKFGDFWIFTDHLHHSENKVKYD